MTASPPAGGRAWSNWARTASCRPAVVEHPGTEEEIAQAIQAAAGAGRRVRVAGTGHSFTDLCCTDGTLLQLDRCDRVRDVQRERGLVTVDGGITISRLSDELDRHDLALPNLGDVTYQTISGAISTATHGTGQRRYNIPHQLAGLSPWSSPTAASSAARRRPSRRCSRPRAWGWGRSA
jgi:L-gulono-1,4-lactone dehydrogenase